MAPTKLIPTIEAAELKGCSRNAILSAVKRGAIDGVQAGRYYVICANAKFDAWEADPERQQIGRDSQKPAGARRHKRK